MLQPSPRMPRTLALQRPSRSRVTETISGMGLGWDAALGLVCLIYFYSHYLFASTTAHIGAMYGAVLSVAVSAGAPPVLSALVLGYLSNVMGCITNYGIGSAPAYAGSGYVPQVRQPPRCAGTRNIQRESSLSPRLAGRLPPKNPYRQCVPPPKETLSTLYLHLKKSLI